MSETWNRLVLIVPLMVLASLVAGCHEGLEPTAEWTLRGDFHETATQDDIDAIDARLQEYQASMLVLESFPMQFQINGPVAGDCAPVRTLLLDHEMVATVGPCETVNAG